MNEVVSARLLSSFFFFFPALEPQTTPNGRTAAVPTFLAYSLASLSGSPSAEPFPGKASALRLERKRTATDGRRAALDGV